MKWRTVAILGFILVALGLITPQGRLLVMSYYEKLKSLIAGEEGLRLDVYNDVGGKPTIGYGHLIKPGEVYAPYGDVTSITPAEADLLFQADVADAEACVDQSVMVPLTENQRAALVSFIYNVGCGAFRSSHLLAQLNGSNYQLAAEQFDAWILATQPDGTKIQVPALIARRAREKEIFLA
jgi:lysozyme